MKLGEVQRKPVNLKDSSKKILSNFDMKLSLLKEKNAEGAKQEFWNKRNLNQVSK